MKARTFSTRLSRLVVVVSILLAASQFGCDGSSSPTGVYMPPPPPAEPIVSSASYLVQFAPWNAGGAYPLRVEIQVDGVSIFEGVVDAPYDDSDELGQVGIEHTGTLAVGTHSFTFLITDQASSPSRYYISGNVSLLWTHPTGSVQLEATRWQDVPVRLRTGQTWTTEFVVENPA